MSDAPRSLAGHVLGGRYRIESSHRPGARSGTFIATDLQLERQVVVRLVAADLGRDPDFLQRFRTTASVAAGMEHPNLVQVLDWGVDQLDGEPAPFFVVEYLAGGTLRQMLDRGRLLTPSQALMVGLDVCRALDAVHRRQMFHGDVRPKHLVFGADRRVRLGDVAVAGVLAERAWREPERVELGRARYAAPEQARGRPLAPPTDVYALCLTLIEAVTGELPFNADSTVLALSNRMDRLMPVSADLGPLAAVFERAGRADPADRFTAAEFGAALVQAAQKLPRPAPIPLVGVGLFADAAPAPPGGWPGPDVTGDIPRTPVAREPEPPVAPAASPVEPPPGAPVPVVPPPAAPLPPAVPPPPAGEPSRPALYDDAAHASADEPTAPQPVPATAEQPVLTPRRGRRRIRRGVAWLLAMVLLVGAAVLGVLAYQALSTKSHPVPALVGRDLSEVGNLIADYEWELVVQRERNDEQPVDAVIRTVPVEGESLNEGDTLVVVVSMGPTFSPLPEIEGLQVEVAEQRLEDLGLLLVVAGLRYDEIVPEGGIISWTVPDDPSLTAGAEVVKGTEISVLVSQGPEPRTMPDIVGRDPVEAVDELQEMGLVPVQYPDVFSDDVEAGLIVAQDPPPGERLERGAEVRYSLSKGPDVVAVPPLAGLTFDEVVAALEEAGLTVGDVTGDTSLQLLGVAVDGSPVRAGELFRRGTPVDLVYSFPP